MGWDQATWDENILGFLLVFKDYDSCTGILLFRGKRLASDFFVETLAQELFGERFIRTGGGSRGVCMYVCMVITYSRVWINRVRLPILLVVS